ncbi:MAG: hypothetical protein M3O84_05370 [Actinomycetota bacterium]|nr:hypothetical protein [Actinomycetota bacterium]
MRTADSRPRHAAPRAAGAILVIALATAACGRFQGGTGPGTGGSPSPAPGSSDALVLRMDTSGGFVAPQTTLQSMPGFSLFADGRVITQGAQMEIYPGPALPSVVVTQITPEGDQALVQAALDAGLGANHSYTTLTISDMPTTTFTLMTNGVTYTTSVYALGAGGGTAPGMSSSERAARAALEKFSAELTDLRGSLPQGSVGADKQYTPGGLRVFVQLPQPTPDPGLDQKAATWPLSTPLARFGKPAPGIPGTGTRCGTVTGSDLDRLLPLARSANQLTPWRSEGATFSLVFRVLLPDEEGC